MPDPLRTTLLRAYLESSKTQVWKCPRRKDREWSRGAARLYGYRKKK